LGGNIVSTSNETHQQDHDDDDDDDKVALAILVLLLCQWRIITLLRYCPWIQVHLLMRNLIWR
jgi:hypothetical protein